MKRRLIETAEILFVAIGIPLILLSIKIGVDTYDEYVKNNYILINLPDGSTEYMYYPHPV